MPTKNLLLSVATLLAMSVAGRQLEAQNILPNGQPCQCESCRQAAQVAYQQWVKSTYAERQAIFGPKTSMFEVLGGTAGGVQPAGHHGGYSAPCPTCNPPGMGGHARGPGGYDPGPHSYGGGTFPYGSQYDQGHPGIAFDGGRYGYFGGAHRTPGYPHHHLHREYVGPQGPSTTQVAYPYYTTRGPRDFLIDNPPTIGR